MRLLFLCAGQAAPVGFHAVGDPHLGAIDDVVATVDLGGRLERRDVGAAAGLADAEAGHDVAGDRGGQVLLAQNVAAEAREGGRGHVGLHTDGHRHAAAIALAQRFGHHHRVAEVEPAAAELLGVLQAQQAEIAELLEQFVARELLGGFPLGDKRVDLLVDELDDRIFQLAVFRGEFHLWSSSISPKRT
jgi:hypothetical protein